ncbi:MAG: hypothetical protein ACJKSS_02360 [Patescibacteria group bacterium UBA2103]
MNKNTIIVILSLIIVGGGFYFFMQNNEMETPEVQEEEQVVEASLPNDSIVGVWQSTEDPNFIRTIYENGGYMDAYEGMEDATTNGPYVTFTVENLPEAFPYEAGEGKQYLELQDDAGSLYFEIVEVTEEKLVLIYLDRGGVLEFTRVEA